MCIDSAYREKITILKRTLKEEFNKNPKLNNKKILKTSKNLDEVLSNYLKFRLNCKKTKHSK